MPTLKNKKVIAGILTVVLVLICWQLYSSLREKPEQKTYIPYVKTVTIGKTDLSEADVFPGEVRGRYESNLSFQVTGKITARLVNIGDSVQKNQILMQLDPKDVLQIVENSNAQYASALANQKLAEDNAQRYASLYASGAVSKASLDQYNTQLEAANAALRQAQAQVNSSQNQLDYTTLRSDIDGIVANISGEAGQIAAAGTPVATVIKNGEREIQIDIPENKLKNIKINQQAYITFWALNNLQVTGSVREISPVADPVTRTYQTRVAISDMPSEAKLGMTAKVTFPKTEKNETVLPLNCIYQINNQPQVWVIQNERVQLRNIEVASYSGNKVIVKSGLKNGDIVVISGIDKLIENQQVKVTESGDL